MIVQTDGSKPHVVYIMETLAGQFPYSIWKIGGKVDRTTHGGSYSYHSDGLACDIYLDAFDPFDLVLGNYLAQMFALNSAELLVNHVIWNKRLWLSGSEADGYKAHKIYKGSGGPHTNHIHVAFNRNPSNILPNRIDFLCREVHEKFVKSSGDAQDRANGLYGKAFNPKRPHIRLTKQQRKKIMLKNMGMEGA